MEQVKPLEVDIPLLGDVKSSAVIAHDSDVV